MKIKVVANELVDGEVEYISLVKHGANRSPFKIVKAEEQERGLWDGLLPELDRLQRRFSESGSTLNQETEMIDIDKTSRSHDEAVEKSDAARTCKLEYAKLRQRLASLNHQQLTLWESPQHPLFEKLDADLTYQIEKCELEFAAIATDHQQDQMVHSSAFFRRGGSSVYSQATVSDSAYERRDSDLRKSVDTIDLSTPITQTDAAEAAQIDLSGIKL